MANSKTPKATAQLSKGVEAGDVKGRDMGTKDAMGAPKFRVLEPEEYADGPVVDETNLTWGETQKGIVVTHS